MEKTVIRWKQRFSNFEKALSRLSEIALPSMKNLSDIEKEGFIQRFEFTHELAWNVMKDFLQFKGLQGIIGSKDATKFSFQNELIDNGQIWMDMIESCNQTVDTYDDEILDTQFEKIQQVYFNEFQNFYNKMKSLL